MQYRKWMKSHVKAWWTCGWTCVDTQCQKWNEVNLRMWNKKWMYTTCLTCVQLKIVTGSPTTTWKNEPSHTTNDDNGGMHATTSTQQWWWQQWQVTQLVTAEMKKYEEDSGTEEDVYYGRYPCSQLYAPNIQVTFFTGLYCGIRD